MRSHQGRVWRNSLGLSLVLALGVVLAMPAPAAAQTERGNPHGEWRYQSADAWGTRFSPLTQIDGDNFEDLELQWVWRGDNFSPHPLYLSRSTPSYIDGLLYNGRRVPPHGRGDRPRDWRDALDVSRAQHATVGRVDAGQLRQGRRLLGDRWARHHLCDHTGVLPARAGCENRRASGGLRITRADPRFPAHGGRRPARGPRP